MLPAQHEMLSGPALGVINQFWSYCIWTIKGSRNTGIFLSKGMILNVHLHEFIVHNSDNLSEHTRYSQLPFTVAVQMSR